LCSPGWNTEGTVLFVFPRMEHSGDGRLCENCPEERTPSHTATLCSRYAVYAVFMQPLCSLYAAIVSGGAETPLPRLLFGTKSKFCLICVHLIPIYGRFWRYLSQFIPLLYPYRRICIPYYSINQTKPRFCAIFFNFLPICNPDGSKTPRRARYSGETATLTRLTADFIAALVFGYRVWWVWRPLLDHHSPT